MAEPKAEVLALVRKMKAPVHVAALSVAYKMKTGRSMKQDHKGGMLRFLREACADELVTSGEGNDTFVFLATPTTRARQWLRTKVRAYGPILVSMLGRMFHEEFGRAFSEECGEGVSKFLRRHCESEFRLEVQKGQEVLVDLRCRSDPRAFLSDKSKKLKPPPKEEEDGARVEGLLALGGGTAYRDPSRRVLLVGEADFSFAAALLSPSRPAAELTATSYDSVETLCRKYGEARVRASLRSLRAAGATVLHGVDAAALHADASVLRRAPFDVVAFHFPHAGGADGLDASIAQNQQLVRAFLRAARGVLAAAGEAHLTLVHRYPYTTWLADLARPGSAALREEGLRYLGSAPFEFGEYDGYAHQATSAVDGGALEVATACRTHAWRLAEQGAPGSSPVSDAAAAEARARGGAKKATKKPRPSDGSEASRDESTRRKKKQRTRERCASGGDSIVDPVPETSTGVAVTPPHNNAREHQGAVEDANKSRRKSRNANEAEKLGGATKKKKKRDRELTAHYL
ncbi:hypothetical protein AB1Y20_012208 [Prymnesium parvum]|uniref:25S rRNA (uridine-N(3))-methyltransferase BMT5-like domain-containing protein n=1 Tax=Prymnesium parvum TaxID=97485 RepID=A0AB34INV6_PRYPA